MEMETLCGIQVRKVTMDDVSNNTATGDEYMTYHVMKLIDEKVSETYEKCIYIGNYSVDFGTQIKLAEEWCKRGLITDEQRRAVTEYISDKWTEVGEIWHSGKWA